jgi:RNA polymerase sigma factor (sigma-70 family)
VSDRSCIDELRRKKRRIRTEPLPAEGGDAPDLSLSPETILAFNEAIDQLPPNLKEVVLLKAQGLPVPEIAEKIGIQARAVQLRLAQAFEILRNLLLP